MRFFTAIFPDGKVSAALREERQRLLAKPAGRPSNEFHLTLHFLGELNGQTAQRAAAAVSRLEWKRFEIEVNGISIFPETGIVFASIGKGSVELSALREAEARSLSANGIIVKEERRYHPHITLAKKNSSILPSEKAGSVGTFTAESLSLMSSAPGVGRHLHAEVLKVQFR